MSGSDPIPEQVEYDAARVNYSARVERYNADPTPYNKGLVTKADNRLQAAYSALADARARRSL